MELSVRPSGQSGEKPAGAAARSTSAPVRTETEPADGDRLELSRAAVRWVESLSDKKLQEREWQEALRKKLESRSDILDQLDDANETADAAGESLRVMGRCMKIASNIMSGKKVPDKDIQYLMEHDAKLYQMALSMRRPPKDEESDPVIKDEDEETAGEASSGPDASAAPVSSPATEAPSAPPGGEGE